MPLADPIADPNRHARVVSPINPANAVTASRFLTVPMMWWSVAHGEHQLATFALILCMALDKVDGLVAKLFDCRSAFGEVFDAFADAVCYGSGLLIVALYGWAPAIPVLAILVMGLGNAYMRYRFARRMGSKVVNYKSYAMERLVAYTGYLIGLATSDYQVTFFYWAFPLVMLAILVHDGKRMLVDPVPAVPA